MIFGIPKKIADRTFYVSIFDMKSNLLYYYPKNPEGSLDLKTCLSCTKLNFNFDWLL